MPVPGWNDKDMSAHTDLEGWNSEYTCKANTLPSEPFNSPEYFNIADVV